MLKVARPRGRPRKHPARVAIVTSDGYEAAGSALDPRRAAADYALLDEFTRFLEKRLVTQNLELLRRILAEYFCHCETTLRQFVAQGAMQMGVGPIANSDEQELAEAQRILSQPRSFAQSGSSASAFTFLVTRLRTVRASLLLQFFVEFCQGSDEGVRTFVENPEGFIAIFPLRAPQANVKPLNAVGSLPFHSVDPLPMPRPSSVGETESVVTPKASDAKMRTAIQPTRKKRKAMSSEQINELLREDLSGEDDAADIDDSVAKGDDGVATFMFNRPDRALVSLRDKISLALEKIEQQKPWLQVFDGALPVPFDEEAHPALAERLRSFWSRYGQAVWQRCFWGPLDAVGSARRRSSQRNAAMSFERIMYTCFKELGCKFFYRLDKTRHPGWWYRSYCVDLVGLAAVEGVDECIKYFETQKHARFPDCGLTLPLRSANAGVVRDQFESRSVSKAMWVQSDREGFKDMKRKYEKYLLRKKFKKEAKKASKVAASAATKELDAVKPSRGSKEKASVESPDTLISTPTSILGLSDEESGAS